MITKEKIKAYFEQELENHKTLVYLLYGDKKLLKEERFEEFATELLKRAKKGYWWALAFGIMFFLIGSFYLLNSSNFGSYHLFAGFAYIITSLIYAIVSTKEYYSIKGSMTMLLKLVKTDEEVQAVLDLETA